LLQWLWKKILLKLLKNSNDRESSQIMKKRCQPKNFRNHGRRKQLQINQNKTNKIDDFDEDLRLENIHINELD
jgi:hypothetical protein